MKIELKQFKCWEHKMLEFPDSGMILLSGKSGVGKTSILQAIHFVLYGKGGKVQRAQSKSGCSVCLSFRLSDQEWAITRTKRPRRLIFSITQRGATSVLEDQPAQEKIQDHFGTHFELTSYLQQKGANSFLYASPAEKWECLEGLVDLGIDVDQFQTNLKNKIKTHSFEISRLEGEFNVIQPSFQSKKQELVNKKNELGEVGTKKTVREKRDSLAQRMAEIDGLLVPVKERLSCLSKEVTESVHVQRDWQRAQSTRDQLEQELDKTQKEWEKVQQELSEFNSNEIRKELHASRQELDVLSRKTEMEKLVSEEEKRLQISIASFPYLEPWMDWSKEECKEIIKSQKQKQELEKERDAQRCRMGEITQILNLSRAKKMELEDDLQALLSRYSTMKTAHKLSCPNCDQELYMQDGELFLSSETTQYVTEEELKEVETSIEITKHKHAKVLQNLMESETSLQVLEQLQNKITAIDIPTSIDLETYYSKNLFLEELLDQLDDLQSQTFALHPVLNRMKSQLLTNPLPTHRSKKELSTLIEELELKQKKVDQLSFLCSRLDQTITQLESQLSLPLPDPPHISTEDLLKEQSEQSERMNQLLEEQQAIREEITLLDKQLHFFGMRTQYHDLKMKHQTISADLRANRKLVELSGKLQEKFMNAYAQEIDQTADSVNTSANKYLDLFFETGIQMKLTPFRELKTGKTKVSLHLEITQNGEVFEWNALSGGEVDRIQLAITLAFSEVFASPLLLLDETLSSLDEETAERVLQHVHALSVNRLILVIAHQTVHGIFDDSIPF